MVLWVFIETRLIAQRIKMPVFFKFSSCVCVQGRHEKPQRTESVVLFEKMKAIYEIERAKKVPLAFYACHLILVLKIQGLVICVHITVTLFCSHLCCVSHPYEMGSCL